MKKNSQIFAIFCFLLMIFVNFLANYLPINNQLTAVISDKNPNLFAPAGITFAIWGVIYLSLLVLIVREFFVKTDDFSAKETLNTIWSIFAISSVVNSVWLFLWHYELLFFSVVLMLILLVLLVKINQEIGELTSKISNSRILLFKLAFGIYLGWICIATIANITTFLVSKDWTNLLFSAENWVSILLFIGAGIAIFLIKTFKNLFIGLVIIWAFIGIIIKRNQAIESHLIINYTAIFAIVCIVISLIIFRNSLFKFSTK